jgi:hypothetical protein
MRKWRAFGFAKAAAGNAVCARFARMNARRAHLSIILSLHPPFPSRSAADARVDEAWRMNQSVIPAPV